MIAPPFRPSSALALLLLALAITLPFLGAHHHLPIPTFHQEWLSGALGLAATLTLALARNRSWHVPHTATLPLALVGALWLQAAVDFDIRFESRLVASLYLVWTFLLMLVTRSIADHLGRARTSELLAGALLAGALLLAFTGALQHWAPWLGMPWIFPSQTIKGNVAQPNNFADYLWIGIAAACWLAATRRMHALFLLITLPALIGLSLMSGSRSVYLYTGALTLWLLLCSRARPDGDRRRWLTLAAVLPALLLVLQWMIGTMDSGSLATAQRLAVQGSYDPVRATLWRAALDIFSDHPLLGAGFDSFSRLFFLRIESHPINGAGIPEHSHNLLTEFAAEFGLVGLALLAAGGALLVRGLRQRIDDATKLASGVLLVLGIHSLLEYPLWYANFLAIAALMITLVDNGQWRLPVAPRHRIVLGGLCLAGFAILAGLRRDYVQLEEAANGRNADGRAIAAEAQHAALRHIYLRSLLRPYAALQFASRMPLDSEELAGRLALMKEAQHFSPIRGAVYRHAALLWLAGKEAEALRQWQRAALAYPGEQAHALALLGEAARQEPDLRVFMERCCVQRSF
ncbi:MAG: Wzy polymerase domain-containing protein [Rhodocyclaceae bacterium]|nr:Wzy polymerase domain-containing protein [Rhodocyclaceae bacterium]